MMNILFELIGLLAGLCSAIAIAPQAWQTFRTKDVSGLSLQTFSIYNIGVSSWMVYGIYLHSYQMVIFNGICLCFSIPLWGMIYKYRRR